MKTFLLNKLVRDKILQDMQLLGQIVVFRKLDDGEYVERLRQKLVEEAHEVAHSGTQTTAMSLDELVDMLEVIETLAAELGTDFDSLRDMQAERRAKRGGFNDKLYIERVTLSEGDRWAEYYAKDPVKYPEVIS